MAKPIKLKREEAEADLYECQCGEAQTSALTPCPKCHIALCDICMPFGAGVPCLDCDVDADAEPEID